MSYEYANQKRRRQVMVFALTSPLTLIGGCSVVAPAIGQRPDKWAVPVAANPGLPNLHRVNATLYRSAQPTKEGFSFLDTKPSLTNGDRPIKTVLSLVAQHDDALLVSTGSELRLERIRFNTWHPEDEDVIKFLRIASAATLHPLLLHCRHGSDRTGTMAAIYRIAYEGWTKAEATNEMVNGGFGFHPLWQNLTVYINNLDVNAIKAQVAKQGIWS